MFQAVPYDIIDQLGYRGTILRLCKEQTNVRRMVIKIYNSMNCEWSDFYREGNINATWESWKNILGTYGDTTSDLLGDFREIYLQQSSDDPYGPWDAAQIALLLICNHIHFERDFDVPAEWGYSPETLEAMPEEDINDPFYGCVIRASDKSLLLLGRALRRFNSRLCFLSE